MGVSLWTLENVGLDGGNRPRLDGVSLDIRAGVTAIIGYSGAGKTSLLNLLVGFERPDRGDVASHVAANDRLPLFWTPQNDGLWQHLTVREHLEVVLPPQADAASESTRILRAFDLEDLAARRPGKLSQGERSRLSTSRAIASGAQVLVLDEPLSHVDPARVGKYWEEIRVHCRMTETSLVIATHSPPLVLAEADAVVCLKEGRVVYDGDVSRLYHQPPSAELADFLGPANWISPDESADWLALPSQSSNCLRPEQLSLEPSATSPLVVQSARFAGSVAEVELLHEPSQRRRRFFHRPADSRLKAGDRVLLKIGMLLLFCLLIAGCDRTNDPEMPVEQVKHWKVPPEPRALPSPRSMTIGPDGEVFVLDNAGRILVYDESGTLQRQWKMPDYDIGKPEGICVLEDGRIAIADTHYHRVVFFDMHGTLVGMQGEYGFEPGQFVYPVGITRDDKQHFYVCEYGSNDRVQKFKTSGEFVLEFGTFGTGPGEFQRPSGVAWRDGRVYVADAINNRIQVFSDDGKFIECVGGEKNAPLLHYPYDVTNGPAGELFVVEYGAGRITQLDLAGKVLARFGTTGRGERDFFTPWGLAMTSAGHILVADTGNRRIVELVR